MALRIVWPGAEGATQEIFVPLPMSKVCDLQADIKKQFGAALAKNQNFILTDTVSDIVSDEDVSKLKDGSTLLLTLEDRALAAPTRERITFQPHPKTLTMAGDYEYFAAQGRHPFVYALAEFIDNSLRATRKNAPLPRRITISFVVVGSNTANAKGLICVTDNGCGMTKHELNDWAVMNYSMEERGSAPQEPEVANRGGGPGAGRFLSGDLSYFGVGSKNAAFFMGSCVKVATRKAGERYVHELCLAAEDLEQRYRNQEAVYEEDMIHRNPGDESTLASFEESFAVSRNWIRSELKTTPNNDEGFTRVIVGNLKPDVLMQLMHDAQGKHICQELAHLYHYYLHGESGNRNPDSAARQTTLPNGELSPDIVLQYSMDARPVWQRRLVDVDDDMETKILRCQKSELQFTMDVPGKGTVCGVLYYFPYENDHETVPIENPGSSSKPIAPSPFAATQMPLSQMPHATQMHRPTQFAGVHANNNGGAAGGYNAGGELGSGGSAMSDDEDGDGSMAWRAPIFEAFWQGRLIPGARIESLPFIEAVRQKRSAQAKDNVPDEVFARLRGALFFGPTFKVTRNKLLFRDNLQEVLASAVPGDRNLEKRFREWLTRSHATLDKSIRFEALADSKTQAALRAKLGEGITAFDRISHGNGAISKGDIVRINVKPVCVGRVNHFTIPRAVREEGAYSNGRVHVEALPAEVHGLNCIKDFSLRRLECSLDEKELAEHTQRELARVPVNLRVEPMRFATGADVEFAAGDSIPETTIMVMSAAGQKLVRSYYGGKKQSIAVMQRLWKLPHEGAEVPLDVPATSNAIDSSVENPDTSPAAEEPAPKSAKRSKKGRRGKGKQDENVEPEGGNQQQGAGGKAGGSSTAAVDNSAELILSVENKVPNRESFMFARLADGLKKAGHYALEYLVSPPVPGQEPVRLVVPLRVNSGAPTSLDISGEGRAAAAMKELALGETLPPLTISLSDEHGNKMPVTADSDYSLRINAFIKNDQGSFTRSKEVAVTGEIEVVDGVMKVTECRVQGAKKALASRTGLDLLRALDVVTGPSFTAAQRNSQPPPPIVDVYLLFRFKYGSDELESEYIPVKVRAGAPKSVALAPGSTWGEAAAAEGTTTVDTDGQVLELQNGQELPSFKLIALDAWGNLTAPTSNMAFSAVVDCGALTPATREVSFAENGVAYVDGLKAAVSTKEKEWDIMHLGVKCSGTGEGIQAAIAAAEPMEATYLKLRVVPSNMPVSLQLVLGNDPLPVRVVEDDDGPNTVAILNGFEAGTPANGFKLILLDEMGNPSSMPVSGKINVSWYRGSKKITWNGEPAKLPPIYAPENVNEVANEWVRFQGTAACPITLECGVSIKSVPAAATTWTVSMLDHVNSQCPEDLGVIKCAEPFTMEIEALDKFGNRCGGGSAGLIPEPQIILESDGPLQYDPSTWEKAWIKQGDQEIYSVKMAVSGRPGPVKVIVRDSADEASTLTEDSVMLELKPGPPAALVFEGPSTIACSTRAALSLAVRVIDAAGNRVDPSNGGATKEKLDVLLSGSALASDGCGRAAKVAVKGGSSKVRAVDGVARFTEVLATAEAPGSYQLRAQSGSRKFALEEAVVTLVMQPQNTVTDLSVLVPAELKEHCHAGCCSGRLLVSAATEDGLPLHDEAALSGLLLRVTPPGGNKSDIALYNLLPGEQGGAPMEDGAFVFEVPELNVAGVYSVAAEYSESRADILAGMPKKNVNVRSSTSQFTVLPGSASTLTLEVSNLPDRLTATNGSSAKQRTLLKNVAIQLRDCHGNATQAAGLHVRFILTPATDHIEGSSLPGVQASDAADALESDVNGRAFFGTLALVESTGTAPAGRLECFLTCQVLGLSPTAEAIEFDEEGWATCWKCPLLFCDDAARFATLEKLSERRAALTARRGEVSSLLEASRRTVASAVKEQQRALRQAVSKARTVSAPAPETVQDAEIRIEKLKKNVEGAGGSEAAAGWHARYGPANHPITSAIDLVLSQQDASVMGVFAQLMTVDNAQLAQVASASIRGMLNVVLVKDNPTRSRLTTMLQQERHAIPDILAMTHTMPYRGPTKGDIPGFENAGQLAQSMTKAACSGTDRPLPLPLPHTRAIEANGGKCPANGLQAKDWPKGCLGYLVNLVRPVQKGQRVSLLAGMLGSILIFESMNDASEYREYVTQKLKSGMSDILTLDMGRITAKGIVSGSSFRTFPVEKADFVIGSTPEGQRGNGAQDTAAELALLESLLEALRAKEAADAAVAAAEQQVAAEEEACGAELAQLEVEISQVDEQLANGNDITAGTTTEAPAAAGTGGSKRTRQQRDQDAAEALHELAQDAEVEPEQAQKGGKTKRKRLTKMQ